MTVLKYWGDSGTNSVIAKDERSNTNAPRLHESKRRVRKYPPAQAMSKVVPFKGKNDILRDTHLPDIDYRVTLHNRTSVKRGPSIVDATLTAVVAKGE